MSFLRCFSCFALALCAAGSARADFVVNTVADEDADNASCSLREAITAVNLQADYNGCSSATAGEQHISFALPSETITLGGPLPPIARQIFIDGTAQGPAVCAPAPPSVHVYLVGSGNTSDSGTGLEFAAGSDGSVVEGIALWGFGTTTDSGNARAAILIESTNVTVGCDVLQNSTYGVNVQASGAVIGVANATEWLPNLISGNYYNDVYLTDADNAVISGNYIGVDATGLVALDSGGINVSGGTGVVIGLHVNDGSAARQRNVIAVHAPPGHAANDVTLTSSNTVVAGNYIGVGADGQTALALGIGSAIAVGGDSNLVGCDGTGTWDDCRNVIVAAGSSGSSVTAVNAFGTHNAIINNFIDTTADGTTSLGGQNSVAVVFSGASALLARNVINSGSQGQGIELYPFPTAPVFLNLSDGAFLDSSDNCIQGNADYGLTAPSAASPDLFVHNWWGSADGPNDPLYTPPINGSGDYIQSPEVTVTPFLTSLPVYCGFDHIFRNGFE